MKGSNLRETRKKKAGGCFDKNLIADPDDFFPIPPLAAWAESCSW